MTKNIFFLTLLFAGHVDAQTPCNAENERCFPNKACESKDNQAENAERHQKMLFHFCKKVLVAFFEGTLTPKHLDVLEKVCQGKCTFPQTVPFEGRQHVFGPRLQALLNFYNAAQKEPLRGLGERVCHETFLHRVNEAARLSKKIHAHELQAHDVAALRMLCLTPGIWNVLSPEAKAIVKTVRNSEQRNYLAFKSVAWHSNNGRM